SFAHDRRRNVHAILPARGLQKMCRRFVTESARTKMHAHPNSVLFIGENIDVMVPASDRAELIDRGLLQLAHRRQLPRRIVEQLVIDSRFAFLADAEGNIAHDIVHDFFHRRRDLRSSRVGANGEIAAGDIEADTGEPDLVRVSYYAADRLRVTFVAVRAQDRPLAARRHAPFDLRDRRFVVLSKYFGVHRVNFSSSTLRHASTSSRDFISAGLMTAFTESKTTSVKGSVSERARSAFRSSDIVL